MSTPENTSTAPDTTVSPVTTVPTVTPESTEEKIQVIDSPTPETTVKPAIPATPTQILDGVNALCNTTLYVLTKGMFPGADAHLVNQAKEFIKEIKKDVESKRKAVAKGEKVEGL